mmetsp:Transcript_14243/g.39256  ORF Transcript_14243/g.39256 Transcript_14243/m.39256 type:complete len:290 (+) Transcript_14243:527-1396(+)
MLTVLDLPGTLEAVAAARAGRRRGLQFHCHLLVLAFHGREAEHKPVNVHETPDADVEHQAVPVADDVGLVAADWANPLRAPAPRLRRQVQHLDHHIFVCPRLCPTRFAGNADCARRWRRKLAETFSAGRKASLVCQMSQSAHSCLGFEPRDLDCLALSHGGRRRQRRAQQPLQAQRLEQFPQRRAIGPGTEVAAHREDAASQIRHCCGHRPMQRFEGRLLAAEYDNVRIEVVQFRREQAAGTQRPELLARSADLVPFDVDENILAIKSSLLALLRALEDAPQEAPGRCF